MDGNFTPGLILLFTVFCQVSCYEKCTHGYVYHYCYTGSCCKIGYEWYCTGIYYNPSDCDSFRVTTKAPTTTVQSIGNAYTNVSSGNAEGVIPVVAVAGSVGVVVLFCLSVVCFKRYRRQNNSPYNSLPTTTGSQPIGHTPRIYYVPGTNAGVRIQPNQTSNGGRMVLHHGQQIHIGSYDISNMHDNRPIDQQHQMTGQYQSACPPPSYENAINTSESAGECEQV